MGGRTVVYAHDQPTWFANLVNAGGGDPVTVTRQDGTVLHYQVTANYLIGAADASILQPGDHEQLVLITCTGWSNSDPKRVVVAETTDPPPPFTRPWTGGSDAIAAGAPSTDAYFAEGYTGSTREGWQGWNFQEFITVANNGGAQNLQVDYFLGTGSTVTRYYTMGDRQRITINVSNYFAEGYTGPGFTEFLTILNPGNVAANLGIDYLLKDRSLPPWPYTVPAHSRRTIKVNDVVGPNQEVSIHVYSLDGNPVLVERPMYFSYGPGWTGGHVVVGATRPATSLSLAEGYVSQNFDEFVTLTSAWIGAGLPPAGLAPVAWLYFHLADGEVIRAAISVPLGRRATLRVKDVLPPNTSSSITIASSDPNVGLVAERPMYFNKDGKDGGHDAVAVPDSALATDLRFAEGYTGTGFEEWLTVLNPDPNTAASAYVIYYPAGAAPIVTPLRSFPPNSRTTILVNSWGEAGPGRSVASEIQVTNGIRILAERSMYFAY